MKTDNLQKVYSAPSLIVDDVMPETGFAASGSSEGEAAKITNWNDYNEF